MNPWHYPRTDLASKYLTILETGLITVIALFARRRAGKTEFVTHDLLPAAQEKGATAYIFDFWANEDSPEECIVAGVIQTLNDLPLKKKLKGLALKEFTIGLNGIKASLSSPSISTINQAFELIRVLHKDDSQKVVLFFDEIQHLATKPEYSKIASALRTFIDKNKDWLYVIFTGSSQDGLQRLFSQKKSALFQAASVMDFPLLGSQYVHHMVNEFNAFTNLELNLNDALRVFKKINNNPEKFKRLIDALLSQKTDNINACFEALQGQLKEHSDMESRWDSLSDTDACILEIILDTQTGQYISGLYSQATYLRVQTETGKNTVQKSTVQNAITRLRKNGWIFNAGQGHWVFEDQTEADFIRQQTKP